MRLQFEVYRLSAVERMETKEVSQGVEVDATPPSPVGSASVKTSPDVIPGGDHVARVDAK